MRIIPNAPNIFNNVNDLPISPNRHTMAVANIHHKSMASNTANAIKSQKNSSLTAFPHLFQNRLSVSFMVFKEFISWQFFYFGVGGVKDNILDYSALV